MTLPELLQRFFFDGKVRSLVDAQKYTHAQLLQEFKDYKHPEQWEVRGFYLNPTTVLFAIGIEGRESVFLETLISRRKRIFDPVIINTQTEEVKVVEITANWVLELLPDEIMQIDY